MAPLILRRLVWLIGVIIAIAAGWLLYRSGQVMTSTVEVLETSVTVPKDTVLTSSMLVYVKVQRPAVNPAAVRQPGQLIGKMLTVPLPNGQQILPEWVSPASTALQNGNYVSVPIGTNPASAASGTLQAGEQVALLWIPGGLLNQAPKMEFLTNPLAIITVRDASGNVISGPGAGIGGGKPAIVDLRATPQEAVTIEGQMNSGHMIIVGITQKEGRP